MKKDMKSDVQAQKVAPDNDGNDNVNLIAVLIALVVLVVVAAIYWDRQTNRNFRQARAEVQAVLVDEWGPQTQQQINSALAAQPVAFSQHVSYKNIVAMVAPSVVSVNVGTSLVSQGALAQNIRGSEMGGVGRWLCPSCNTTIPCWGGNSVNSINCPSCGMGMFHGCPPGGCPLLGQRQQLRDPNLPASSPLDGGLLGQFVWGGRMGGQGLGPAGSQQAANPPNNNRFQAQGRGGSGVIVNSQGYVLTNHHVIHGARSIAVTLSLEGITKTYPAELIDEAPNLDFAVLKIIGNGDVFTPARIGVSSAMSVGDEVLAIGSPFGLQQTVTAGIVSNTRRTLTVGSRTFRNFIQTDTSINPGSSGGPLVNIKGEVIGLTTAIYSPTQAFSGIGFASPIDPAKAAFPEFIDVTSNALGNFKANIPNWARGPALKNAAQVQRGQGLNSWYPPGTGVQQIANTRNQPWLGIHINGVNKQSRKFLGLPMAYGAVVMQVFNNSPCMKAGLQRGDVIFRADNRSVKDAAMLESLFGEKIVGDKIKLTAYRDGKKMTFDVELLARQQSVIPQAMPVALPAAGQLNPQNTLMPGLTGALQGGEVGGGEIEALGMEIVELSPVLATTLGIPKSITGLLVAESTLQAAAAGLLANDVIEGVNGRRVETLSDFVKTMNKASLTNGISLGVYRQGQRLNLMLSG
ncbi:MAG: hypothetical protein CEE38_19970 [Planctomycetes bacterium B3_Pla]|nr:MAG: hypothetical protein CEE38_19970 [Planctomycetes bacterium B3_Pla]